MFSGLNLAFFSISRLQLEIEAADKNKDAVKVLGLRKDSNFLLATILWGNVGVNTLLALLSGSVIGGVAAFLFSTVFITIFAEIIPQAYFSRNALRVASTLSPAIRFYQFLFYPVAKPAAKVLDAWLGPEGVHDLRETMLRKYIARSMGTTGSDIDKFEGRGAVNFLALDSRLVGEEGQMVDPRSVVGLSLVDGRLEFPKRGAQEADFVRGVQASGRKWVILIAPDGTPHLLLNADRFLRALFSEESIDPHDHCVRPIVTKDPRTTLEQALMSVGATEGKPTDERIILLWGEEKRIVTRADLLKRLFEGVLSPPPSPDDGRA
jgi:hypothetical protein